MGITTTVRKKLWGKSGARCAICKIEIFEPAKDYVDKIILGEEAHISGDEPGSARYDSGMSEVQRDAEENLILLCPTDHTKIDKNVTEYTIVGLRIIKKDHELWVQDAIREEMPNITYAELEVTIGYLVANTGSFDDSVSFVKPKEKIRKNGLSIDIENLITTGMSRVQEVKNYLNTNPDIYFADKLKLGLVNKYNELRNQVTDGDTIFLELLKFASRNSRNNKIQASALAVIVYFFEACDIFEK
jgi:hypothetical protein